MAILKDFFCNKYKTYKEFDSTGFCNRYENICTLDLHLMIRNSLYFFIYKKDGYQMPPSRSGRNRFIKYKAKVFSNVRWG